MPKNMDVEPRRDQSQLLETNVCDAYWLECKMDRQLLEKLALVKEPIADTRSTCNTAKDFKSNCFLECNKPIKL